MPRALPGGRRGQIQQDVRTSGTHAWMQPSCQDGGVAGSGRGMQTWPMYVVVDKAWIGYAAPGGAARRSMARNEAKPDGTAMRDDGLRVYVSKYVGSRSMNVHTTAACCAGASSPACSILTTGGVDMCRTGRPPATAFRPPPRRDYRRQGDKAFAGQNKAKEETCWSCKVRPLMI